MQGTPPPPPGWYPYQTGQQRYWDGQAWHHVVGSPPKSGQATSRRRFVTLAIASAVTGVVAFVLMQVAFSIGAVWLQVLGLALFPVVLVSGVVMIVSIVGAIVGRVK